jgi:DNA helicase-2/ATP-dependent DNA helicase PcrA
MTHTLDPEKYLANLTPTQREAVLCTEGPLLILAGPGSGKTRVITCRIAHLIHQGVRPYQILAITFTHTAAREMRRRVEELLPTKGMWISTFHSVGVRLLRSYADKLGLEKNFTIYDQADRVRVVKTALEAAQIDNVRFTPETIQGAISKAKNQLLTWDKFASSAGDFFSKVVAQVYEVYEKRMRAANALDFDDLLLWPALAVKNDPELRAELDARFRYVLVDEYQDTNKAQYALARGLSVDYPNLCVVGDPDQSIYRWRGADIKNILDFERDFPDAKVITLAENFRSTQTILQVADELIAHNKQRKPKTLTTTNPVGSAVQVLEFENALDEADQIARRIKADVAEGKHHYRDFALFMRMNALSRNLEGAFIRAKVPYQIVRGLAFFDRKENKDILAYLRLLLNPRDDVSFSRVVNEPTRGVGKVSLDHLQQYAEPRELSLLTAIGELNSIPAIKGKAASGLRAFATLLEDLRKLLDFPPDEIIRQVIHQTGYRIMLATSGDEGDQERLANIEELITAAKQFHTEDPTRTLADFLENITLASDADSYDEKQDCVAVMTLHAAKGLEFPVVYMLAMEQGILPHERSMVQDAELEEERRLAFVGITRAKEELHLTHCRMREFRGQTLYAVASMFLDEIPQKGVEVHSSRESRPSWGDAASWRGEKDLPLPRAENKKSSKPISTVTKEEATPKEFAAGALVHHETYGVGRILKVTGHGAARKLKIRFTKAGERTFMGNKVKLAIVQGT